MEHAFDSWHNGGMRGDRVEIVIDTGDGVRSFDVVATRAGRRVEASTTRTVIEVTEVTRNGTPVRSARFMASRVVALVEHPAAEANASRPLLPTAADDGEGGRQPPAGGDRPDDQG
jgi:hypothetical protein